MTAAIWDARRVELNRVIADMTDDPDELEVQAAKLMQRARDIRRAVEVVAFIKAPKPPRCIECDADIGTCHFGFCSYFGDGAGERVE